MLHFGNDMLNFWMMHFVIWYITFCQRYVDYILSMICYILPMICYASFPRWSAQMARFTTVTKTCESGLELRSAASSRETKLLQLVWQKKIGGDAKKPSESSSGDKGSFELWWWSSVDVWNCNSFVSSSNFAVPPCPSVLDTLSWPDNSCSENET